MDNKTAVSAARRCNRSSRARLLSLDIRFNHHCSASIITNEWIIPPPTAECERISNPSQVTLTANWRTVQTRQAREIRSLRSGPTIGVSLPDIALIRVGDPFNVAGSTQHFRRELIGNKMDNLVGYPIETWRGLNVLAQSSGNRDAVTE